MAAAAATGGATSDATSAALGIGPSLTMASVSAVRELFVRARATDTATPAGTDCVTDT